jgi:hypothetical protein
MQENERLAFWLTPLAAVVPLIPFFSIPASPWFLGRLMADPTGPMSWPGVGPWLAAVGVVFNGTILGYVVTYAVVLPIYFLLKDGMKMSLPRLMVLFCLAGVFASQVVHLLQNFRQAPLREFAEGWVSPLFGCLCGAVAGLFFAMGRRWRTPGLWRGVIYTVPVATLAICAFVMVQSARMAVRLVTR